MVVSCRWNDCFRSTACEEGVDDLKNKIAQIPIGTRHEHIKHDQQHPIDQKKHGPLKAVLLVSPMEKHATYWFHSLKFELQHTLQYPWKSHHSYLEIRSCKENMKMTEDPPEKYGALVIRSDVSDVSDVSSPKASANASPSAHPRCNKLLHEAPMAPSEI